MLCHNIQPNKTIYIYIYIYTCNPSTMSSMWQFYGYRDGVQILDEAVCVSLHGNAIGKSMNPSVLSTMGK